MITLELVALGGLKLSEEIYEVVIPTPDGLIAIFPHHMPLISLVTPGVISVRRSQGDADDRLEHFATNGGVVEINEHRVRVLVDEADHSDEITVEETEAALRRAKELAAEAKDQVSLDKANQIIATQHARLKVAGLRRHKRR